MKARAPKTIISYEGHLRLHLLPFFTGTGLDDVGKLWPRYRATQRELNPKRKLVHDRKHLIRILRYAYDQELIHRVPRLDLDLQDKAVRQGETFSNEDYEKLMARANESWRLKIALAVKTGMRRNTIRLLKWEYVDWNAGLIRIPGEAMKMRGDHIVALTEDLIGLLKTRLKSSKNGVWVFPNSKDASRPESLTGTTWQRIKRQCGLDHKVFHDTRRTFANRALRSGASTLLVQKSAKMSARVLESRYLVIEEDDRKRLAEAVSNSFRKVNPC